MIKLQIKPRKILIIEEHGTTRDFLSGFMSSSEKEIYTAHSGEPTVGQAALGPGMHAALFSLARAGQTARVGRRAVPVVSGGETHPVYYPLSPVGAQ